MFKPILNFTSRHLTLDVAIVRQDYFIPETITNYTTRHGVDAYWPINLGHRQFRSLNFRGGLSYYHFRATNYTLWGMDFLDIYDDGDMVMANVGVNYLYNLPWRNDVFHPVRQHKVDLTFEFADEELGMNRDYQRFSAFSDMSFAPFLHTQSRGMFQTMALHNRSTYRVARKDPMRQLLPGVDDRDFLLIGGKHVASTMFLRGFEERAWGQEIVSFQNDLRLKFFDMNEHNWMNMALLRPMFLGGSLWYDYTQLNRTEYVAGNTWLFGDREKRNRRFEAMGIEVRLAAQILFFPTLHRFGEAWDMKGNKLESYYLMEIGVLQF